MNKQIDNLIQESTAANGCLCAPAPLCMGTHTISVYGKWSRVVTATLTIRALISLAWSRWSRWSRQFQLIAHVRAHARVSTASFILIFIFNLYKNTLTTLTKPIKTLVFALTKAVTNNDHLDQMGTVYES